MQVVDEEHAEEEVVGCGERGVVRGDAEEGVDQRDGGDEFHCDPCGAAGEGEPGGGGGGAPERVVVEEELDGEDEGEVAPVGEEGEVGSVGEGRGGELREHCLVARVVVRGVDVGLVPKYSAPVFYTSYIGGRMIRAPKIEQSHVDAKHNLKLCLQLPGLGDTCTEI